MPINKPKSKERVVLETIKVDDITWLEVCAMVHDNVELGRVVLLYQGDPEDPTIVFLSSTDAIKLIDALQLAKDKL